MKKILVLSLLLFASFAVRAQDSVLTLDNGVKAHKEIDEIYRQFGIAYKTLNVDLVANLYAENANYLAPGNPIIEGRDKIRENFARFFNSVGKMKQTMEISFRILQRETDKNLGYDIGIYTLKIFKDGKEISSGQGKFVVITKRVGKNWVFQYDGYSNLPAEKKG